MVAIYATIVGDAGDATTMNTIPARAMIPVAGIAGDSGGHARHACRVFSHGVYLMTGNVNGNDELPPDHFWDSEQAEKEYHAIGRGIAEAEKRLRQAHICLNNALQGIYSHFSHVPGVDRVLEKRSYPSYPGDRARYHIEWVYRCLNHALNPYWLPDPYWFSPPGEDGRYHYSEHPAPWQGSLVVRKVENETLRGEVWFDREKKRTGAYVHLRIEYSYTKWGGWYAPSGGTVEVSRLEHVLRRAKQHSSFFTSAYNKLLDELIQDVHALVAPLSREVVLKFIPDLSPTNIEDIRYSHGIYKQDVPMLHWPPLTRYEAPKVGERYGLGSYKGIYWNGSEEWPVCGRWEPYRFPEETLRSVCEGIERIESRLRERIKALASRDVSSCEDELLLLRRRQGAVRTRHYKPLAYKLFWSALQTRKQ